jgi:hypothetical protein
MDEYTIGSQTITKYEIQNQNYVAPVGLQFFQTKRSELFLVGGGETIERQKLCFELKKGIQPNQLVAN